MTALDNEFDAHGYPLLHVAAAKGNVEAAERLLERGASVDAR